MKHGDGLNWTLRLPAARWSTAADDECNFLDTAWTQLSTASSRSLPVTLTKLTALTITDRLTANDSSSSMTNWRVWRSLHAEAEKISLLEMCSKFLWLLACENKNTDEQNNVVPNILLEFDCPGCPGEIDVYRRPIGLRWWRLADENERKLINKYRPNPAKSVILFDITVADKMI